MGNGVSFEQNQAIPDAGTPQNLLLHPSKERPLESQNGPGLRRPMFDQATGFVEKIDDQISSMANATKQSVVSLRGALPVLDYDF
jgi:hypothetical protein